MKTNFMEEIDTIVERIEKLNKNILNSNSNSKIHMVDKKQPKDELKVTPITNHKNYKLDQHKWKQQYINYKRNLRKDPTGENTKSFNVFQNNNDLSDFLKKNEYKKKWNRLDNYQKKVKVKEYLRQLVDLDELSIEKSKLLIIKFDILINSKKLKKVDYDSENCKIVSININI